MHVEAQDAAITRTSSRSSIKTLGDIAIDPTNTSRFVVTPTTTATQASSRRNTVHNIARVTSAGAKVITNIHTNNNKNQGGGREKSQHDHDVSMSMIRPSTSLPDVHAAWQWRLAHLVEEACPHVAKGRSGKALFDQILAELESQVKAYAIATMAALPVTPLALPSRASVAAEDTSLELSDTQSRPVSRANVINQAVGDEAQQRRQWEMAELQERAEIDIETMRLMLARVQDEREAKSHHNAELAEELNACDKQVLELRVRVDEALNSQKAADALVASWASAAQAKRRAREGRHRTLEAFLQ
eukprot:jgi/Chlat1/175/Chrsp1S03248